MPDSIEVVARRALDRSTMRAAMLVDRDLNVRWVSPSTEVLLGYSAAALLGTPVFEYVHHDDLEVVVDTLEFEQRISVTARSALDVRAVREVRVRRVDGSFLMLEASLSNFLDDPEIAMLLVDLQVPSQYRSVERAIELTRTGADLHETLLAVLGEQTSADPWHIACAVFDPDGSLLAATPGAPVPGGTGTDEEFLSTWELILSEASSAEPVGRLQVWTHLERPHPLDLESSSRVAAHAAVVIGRHRALQELQRAAWNDSLTGLSNRRFLDDDLQRRYAQGDEVLIAYLDLDGFKLVNDRLGHHAGDEVLVAIAERLRSVVRSTDVVARVGGDEFVVVFGCPLPDESALHDRLAALVLQPLAVGTTCISLSASIGVCRGVADPDDLLRQADREMMSYKRSRPAG